MTAAQIRDALIEGIQEIQTLSGRPDQDIDDETVPLDDLYEFDSLNAMEVTVRITDMCGINAEQLGHLFTDSGRRLSVHEIVGRLCGVVETEGM